MPRPKQICAVCGMGGSWVGYDSRAGEDRCVNHLADASAGSLPDTKVATDG